MRVFEQRNKLYIIVKQAEVAECVLKTIVRVVNTETSDNSVKKRSKWFFLQSRDLELAI